MQVKKQQLNRTWNNGLVPNWERSTSRSMLSPCLFNFYAEYIIWDAGLHDSQAVIKISGRNINNLRYADDIMIGRKLRGAKEPLDEGKRGEWKSWLKTQHSEKIRSWHPVPSLHGKQMEKQRKQWQILYFGGSKITADSDCSHEIKRHFLLEEKLWPT